MKLGCIPKNRIELLPQHSTTVLMRGLQYLEDEQRSGRFHPDILTMFTYVVRAAKIQPSPAECERFCADLRAVLHAPDVSPFKKMRTAIELAKTKDWALSEPDADFLYDALLGMVHAHTGDIDEKTRLVSSIFESLLARKRTLNETQSRFLLVHALAMDDDQRLELSVRARTLSTVLNALLTPSGPLHLASIDVHKGRELLNRSLNRATDPQTHPRIKLTLIHHLVKFNHLNPGLISNEHALQLFDAGFGLLEDDLRLRRAEVAHTIFALLVICHDRGITCNPHAQELLLKQSLTLLADANVVASEKLALVETLLLCNADGHVQLSAEHVRSLKTYVRDSIAPAERDLNGRKVALAKLEQLSSQQVA